jgi:hypothetical protein
MTVTLVEFHSVKSEPFLRQKVPPLPPLISKIIPSDDVFSGFKSYFSFIVDCC